MGSQRVAQATIPSGTPRHSRSALRRLRRAAGLTQAQLAASLGLSQPALSRVESGAAASGAAAIALRDWLRRQGVETPLEEWLQPAETAGTSMEGRKE